MNPFDVNCAFVIKEAPGARRGSVVTGKTVPEVARVASRAGRGPSAVAKTAAPPSAVPATSKARDKAPSTKAKLAKGETVANPEPGGAVAAEKKPRLPRAEPRPATAAPSLPLRNHPQTRPHVQQQRKPVVAFASSAKASSTSDSSAHWNADLRVPDRDSLLIESDLQIYLLKLARWKAGAEGGLKSGGGEDSEDKGGSAGRLVVPKNLPRGNTSPRSRSAFGTSGPIHSKRREDTSIGEAWNVGSTPENLLEEQARALPPPRTRTQSLEGWLGSPGRVAGVAGVVVVEREQDLAVYAHSSVTSSV